MQKKERFFSSMQSRGYKIIGGAGHRYLLSCEIPHYREMIKEYLKSIIQNDQRYLVVTPLADGADRLLVEVAIEMGIEYAVLLPMELELYDRDFDSDSRRELHRLIEGAIAVSAVELYADNTLEAISKYGVARDFQYREAGRILAESSDLFIALWDGEENYLLGGTADIIKWRRDIYKKTLHIIECNRTLATKNQIKRIENGKAN